MDNLTSLGINAVISREVNSVMAVKRNRAQRFEALKQGTTFENEEIRNKIYSAALKKFPSLSRITINNLEGNWSVVILCEGITKIYTTVKNSFREYIFEETA